MTELRLVLDELVPGRPGAAARHAGELGRALVATAPPGVDVVGVVAATPEAERARLAAELPGIAAVRSGILPRPLLRAVLAAGIDPFPGGGMLHAPTLVGPMPAHSRARTPRRQYVATIGSTAAWTSPQLLPRIDALWQRAMGAHAERWADAIVVPTHAAADLLGERLRLGDRLRVGTPAPSRRLLEAAVQRPAAPDGTPERYVLAFSGAGPLQGLGSLLDATTGGALGDAALVLVVPPRDREEVRARAAAAGAETVVVHSSLPDAELAALYAGAAALLHAPTSVGFGLAVLDALAFGVPVVARRDPALQELAAGAVLEAADDAELLEGVRAVLADRQLAERLRVIGQDRARAFSWRDTAERIWQLHAEL